MRILLTHRYFWPDTAPYALMLRSIADGLAQAGHDVSVFASVPSYRGKKAAPRAEALGAIKVNRCRVFNEDRSNVIVRGLNVLIYCLALFYHILRTRPDVVSASTFPPVFAGWFASFAAKRVGARFIYHMMDIHPEVSQQSGGLLGHAPISGILRWFDNQTLRRASAIVVLSEDMAETLRARGLGHLPIEVINNFLLQDFDEGAKPPADYAKPEGCFRVIFAGNLGRFQNLMALSEGVAACFDDHPELELVFLGDGAAEADLRARWKDTAQVKFLPFLPFSEASHVIADADVGLVSLSKGLYRVAYPSKVLTYLGLGLPLLALAEPESQLAKVITADDLGRVPASDAPADIADALRLLLMDPLSRGGIAAWYSNNASKDMVLGSWERLVDGLSD